MEAYTSENLQMYVTEIWIFNKIVYKVLESFIPS